MHVTSELLPYRCLRVPRSRASASNSVQASERAGGWALGNTFDSIKLTAHWYNCQHLHSQLTARVGLDVWRPWLLVAGPVKFEENLKNVRICRASFSPRIPNLVDIAYILRWAAIDLQHRSALVLKWLAEKQRLTLSNSRIQVWQHVQMHTCLGKGTGRR